MAQAVLNVQLTEGIQLVSVPTVLSQAYTYSYMCQTKARTKGEIDLVSAVKVHTDL